MLLAFLRPLWVLDTAPNWVSAPLTVADMCLVLEADVTCPHVRHSGPPRMAPASENHCFVPSIAPPRGSLSAFPPKKFTFLATVPVLLALPHPRASGREYGQPPGGAQGAFLKDSVRFDLNSRSTASTGVCGLTPLQMQRICRLRVSRGSRGISQRLNEAQAQPTDLCSGFLSVPKPGRKHIPLDGRGSSFDPCSEVGVCLKPREGLGSEDPVNRLGRAPRP